jgi:hypothetical protein
VAVDSAGRVLGFGAVRFLHPEDVVFTQMLTGWRNQQLSRNLSFGTIEGRERLVTPRNRRMSIRGSEHRLMWMSSSGICAA